MPRSGSRTGTITTPVDRYDAILSYGAFEHFARDGTTSVERVDAYRRFFARCFEWLKPDGRIGLETIAHDDAPDTASPLGRGPLGDIVLSIFPESICPHLSSWCSASSRTSRSKLLRVGRRGFRQDVPALAAGAARARGEAIALVGADTVRRFRRYLVSSEIQFRTRGLTNYRVVLQRRPVTALVSEGAHVRHRQSGVRGRCR